MVEEIRTRQTLPSSRVDIHAPSETNASMAIMSSFATMSFPKVCRRRCGKVSWSVDVGGGGPDFRLIRSSKLSLTITQPSLYLPLLPYLKIFES